MKATLLSWIDPSWWIAFATSVFLAGAFGLAPIMTKPDASASELWAALVRRASIAAVLGLPAFAAVITWAGARTGDIVLAREWWTAMTWRYGIGVFAAAAIGFIIRVLTLRYIVPAWSAFTRRLRVEQLGDAMTDIRTEVGRFQPIDFDPASHFDPESLFIGLSEERTRITLPWDVFEKTHMQVIGPTRYGKGVLLGSVLAQSIRRGYGAWFFDPKEDEHIPFILADEAKRAGRPFIVLDLVSRIGEYSPFAGGTEEERAQRVITAFRLESGGGDADFYKRTERQLLRKIFGFLGADRSDLKTIAAEFKKKKLEKFAGNEKRATDSSAIEDGLDEWAALSMIAGKPTSRSLDVAKALRDRAIVFVRCRTRGITQDVARCLLQEVAETALRERPKRRGHHIVLVLDEARALISNVVVDAFTTVAGAGCTMIPAYQSPLDMRNLDDARLDPDVVEASVNVNCQVKVCHGIKDPDAAEFISKLTGTRRVRVAQMEATEVGAFGGERWGDGRNFREDDDQLITANTVSALPARVAVFVAPDNVARLTWTSWMRYSEAALAAKVGEDYVARVKGRDLLADS